jgi:enoyl-[acyl-carrier protein] reductase I
MITKVFAVLLQPMFQIFKLFMDALTQSLSSLFNIKALLENITRSFGYHYGKAKKVRVNTISQSPTKTTAGSGVGGFDAFFDYADKMSPLGNASAEDCANYCISLFSDFTRMVTMQNLFHDGGFSSTGISTEMMEKFAS